MTKFDPEANAAIVAKAANALTEGDKTEYHQALRSAGNNTVAERAALVREVQVEVSFRGKDKA